MIRDPFDIHRNNIFKATASRTANRIRDTAAQVGANALENMAFSMPRNLPNFESANRDLEDGAWSSLRGAGNRVTGMFDKEALPMYKDKPFTYTPSYKNRPLYKKKRFFGSLVLGVVFFFYLLGFFSSPKDEAKQKSSWSWMGLGDVGKTDWEQRRSKVVEAFQLSWDTYERYAWGTSNGTVALGRALIIMEQATTSITPSRRRARTWRLRVSAGLLLTRWTP